MCAVQQQQQVSHVVEQSCGPAVCASRCLLKASSSDTPAVSLSCNKEMGVVQGGQEEVDVWEW